MPLNIRVARRAPHTISVGARDKYFISFSTALAAFWIVGAIGHAIPKVFFVVVGSDGVAVGKGFQRVQMARNTPLLCGVGLSITPSPLCCTHSLFGLFAITMCC